MPSYQEFSASVRISEPGIGGRRMEEYGVFTSHEDFSKGPVVNCWIPSEVGRNFHVTWKDTRFSSPTVGVVKIDGVRCKGQVIDSPGNSKCKKKDIRTSDTTRRLFAFSPIELTDDDQYLGISVEDLGCIRLEISRVKLMDKRRMPSLPHVPPKPIIHERSKKGIAHQAGAGQEVPAIPREPTPTYKRIGPPTVTFLFHYRPLAQLIADNIAPKTAKPTLKYPLPSASSSPMTNITYRNSLASTPRRSATVSSSFADECIDLTMDDDQFEFPLTQTPRNTFRSPHATPQKVKGEDRQSRTPRVKEEPRTQLPGEVIDLTI